MRKITALVLAAALAAPVFAAAGSEYPAVDRAIDSTQAALKAVAAIKADLGDHKGKANDDLNAALKELQDGLAAAKAKKAEKKADKKAAKAAAVSGTAAAPAAATAAPASAAK
jgi:peptidoglycan hydrolase CwlO-like protein